jgi:HPt (histidine-containing phosphotransfer) domain-containing protein
MNEKPNFIYIDQLADGDLDFKAKLVAVIKKEFPLELQQYHAAVSSNNLFQIAEVVHKLKNKISMLGMESGYLIAQEYEENLKQNSTSKAARFEEVLALMNAFINSF